MSYDRNYNQNAGYTRNYQRGQFNYGSARPNENFKKSGAKFSLINKGRWKGADIINAWKKTKYGLMKLQATPYSDEVVSSKNGRNYMKYIAVITHNYNQQKYTCLYDIDRKRLVIKDLGLIVTNNGSGTTRDRKSVV